MKARDELQLLKSDMEKQMEDTEQQKQILQDERAKLGEVKAELKRKMDNLDKLTEEAKQRILDTDQRAGTIQQQKEQISGLMSEKTRQSMELELVKDEMKIGDEISERHNEMIERERITLENMKALRKLCEKEDANPCQQIRKKEEFDKILAQILTQRAELAREGDRLEHRKAEVEAYEEDIAMLDDSRDLDEAEAMGHLADSEEEREWSPRWMKLEVMGERQESGAQVEYSVLDRDRRALVEASTQTELAGMEKSQDTGEGQRELQTQMKSTVKKDGETQTANKESQVIVVAGVKGEAVEEMPILLLKQKEECVTAAEEKEQGSALEKIKFKMQHQREDLEAKLTMMESEKAVLEKTKTEFEQKRVEILQSTAALREDRDSMDQHQSEIQQQREEILRDKVFIETEKEELQKKKVEAIERRTAEMETLKDNVDERKGNILVETKHEPEPGMVEMQTQTEEIKREKVESNKEERDSLDQLRADVQKDMADIKMKQNITEKERYELEQRQLLSNQQEEAMQSLKLQLLNERDELEKIKRDIQNKQDMLRREMEEYAMIKVEIQRESSIPEQRDEKRVIERAITTDSLREEGDSEVSTDHGEGDEETDIPQTIVIRPIIPESKTPDGTEEKQPEVQKTTCAYKENQMEKKVSKEQVNAETQTQSLEEWVEQVHIATQMTLKEMTGAHTEEEKQTKPETWKEENELSLLMVQKCKQREEMENNMVEIERGKSELENLRAEIQIAQEELKKRSRRPELEEGEALLQNQEVVLVESERQRQPGDYSQLKDTGNEQKQRELTSTPEQFPPALTAKEKLSKRDYLKKIWEEAKTERREIERMKHRVQEMKEHLERRLEVIQNHELIQRTRLQKEKEELEKIKTELERGNQTLLREQDRNQRKLMEKDKQLELIKVEMLREIERLQVDKKRESFSTTDKGIQTTEDMALADERQMRVRQEELTEITLIETSQRVQRTTAGLMSDCSTLEIHDQVMGGGVSPEGEVGPGGVLQGLPEVLWRLWRHCCRCCGGEREEAEDML